ncbi:MAG: hypothetical protein JSV31_31165, partial [Desulfobacterales bacterium]
KEKKETMEMKCDQCNSEIDQGEEREHLGQMLCEDCYMDALSPMRTCDPWAVHSAKTFEQHTGGTASVTKIQSEILRILEETGGIEPEALLKQLKGKLTQAELEREFATLRHMEMVRGEKRGEKIYLRLW